MSTFDNKTTHLTITQCGDRYSLVCDECKLINYLGGSPYAISSHFYKLLVQTLQSMAENHCTQIKVTLSWH